MALKCGERPGRRRRRGRCARRSAFAVEDRPRKNCSVSEYR